MHDGIEFLAESVGRSTGLWPTSQRTQSVVPDYGL